MDLQSLLESADLPMLMANSYKNFHAKDFDYVCLKRTPTHTVKAYFLDGDASKVPEVINPHDHRYTFKTTVLRGAMVDYRFTESDDGDVYQAFDYMTPLNGGNGFTFRGEERLKKTETRLLFTGQKLISEPSHRHTISMRADQTVLLLEQFADVVPIDAPTSCWIRKGYPEPNTTGLYERFTEQEFADRLMDLTGMMMGLAA